MLRLNVATSPYLLGRLPTADRYLRSHGLTATWGEALGLLGILAAIFCGFLWRLPSVVISDMDEGTYLYAGKLLAEGLVPYRDVMLAHPPLIVFLTGGWERLFGTDPMPARVAYMILILASTVPLYLVTRTLAGSRSAGFLSVTAYTTGMLLLANMGRTVRLEPLMNAFLIAGFACYLLRPESLWARALTGALFAIAVLVKLVAVIPVVLFVVGDLVWVRSGRRFLAPWAVAAGGAAVILGPAALLLSQPGFVDDVFRSQLERPGLPVHTRLYFLWQDFVRYPIVPVALAAAAWLLVWTRDPRVRVVSLVALGTTLTLLVAFRTFFGYYLVQALPWMAVAFSLAICPAVQRVTRRWSRPLLLAGTLALGSGVPLAYGEVYYRTAHDHVSSPDRIVSLLRNDRGYLYSMYPSFALWSGRELYPWYYAADSLIPRITGRIGDDEFLRVFSGCQALVLWPDELADYPRARTYVERHFSIAYQDAHYVLWTRLTDVSTADGDAGRGDIYSGTGEELL